VRRREAGVTLIEVMVAVTLLSLLSVGMVMAIRVGLSAYSRTESKLMDNRRVAGAQRIAHQELEGMLPAFVLCGVGAASTGTSAVLFQGGPGSLWMVSTFSLQEGWRGVPRILHLYVIPGEETGVRLAVDELPYNGPRGAGQYCSGTIGIPGTISRIAQMIPAQPGARTFVLADHLASCSFSYYTPSTTVNDPPTWRTEWAAKGWPLAVRLAMVPATADPSRLQPITVTAPLHLNRDPEKVYTDDN
jgi:prepilin-type N-terminal cleavage/methylation domain-containing protein